MNWPRTAIAITITLFIAFFSVPSFSAEEKPESSKGKTSSTTADELKELTEKAKAGDAGAQLVLGVVYSLSGRGIKQDFTEAVKWFRKAAEQGNIDAQFNLGWMYDNGKGVPQDYTEAIKWWRKAADQGLTNAQFKLGLMYSDEEGVKQDYAEAVKWYRKAAEQGYADAMFNLGVAYQTGEGVLQSKHAAADWYYKAGLAYLKEGSKEDALVALDRIKNLVPGHFLAKKLMKKIYDGK